MRRAILIVALGCTMLVSHASLAADQLAGTSWRIESVRNAPVLTPEKSTLSFDRQGRLSTTVGCNRMSGAVVITGSALSIGPVASTRMACDPAHNELEQRYASALADTRTFRVTGDRFVLLDAGGTELATFARLP